MPKDWIHAKEYQALADSLCYRGIPIKELDREELLYIIGEFLNLMGQAWNLMSQFRLDQFQPLDNKDAEVS